MKPVQALSLKVDGYLKEIRSLNNVQNASGGGDANTIVGLTHDNRIRSDKFRCFTLLQSIFTHEEQRMDKSSVETLQGLTKMKNAILDARRELRATKDDIKCARIVMPSRNSLDQFHFYLQLPGPLVRVHILSYLTDPQDQLNMMEAVPSEEQLMHWNREKIKLELVFRITMERESYYDYRSPFGIAYTFSRASQVHQSIVERVIEATWLKKSFYQWPYGYGIHSARVMGALQLLQDVDSQNRLPTCVNFNIFCGRDDDNIDNNDWNISLLQRIGHRIWFFSLSVFAASSVLQVLEVLKNCLSLLPNVKVVELGVSQFIAPGFSCARSIEEIERHLKSIENFHLPECPSLRILKLKGSSMVFSLSLVIRPILAKYSAGLLRLHISADDHIEIPNIVEFQFPKMSVLEVSCDQIEGVYDVPQYLRMLPNARLKHLKLSKLRGTIGRVNFSNILSFVSRHYGGTLEQLELKNLPCHSSLATSIPDSTWMLETSFPKVKSLHLFYDSQQQIGGLTFVMLFPALEELHFSNETNNVTEETFFGTDQNYLELSLNRRDMLKSVIWKLFPKLSFVKFARLGNGGVRVKSRVTRRDCIQVQQNTE